MTLKQYLIIMIIATLMFWGAFGVVLFKIDPTETNFLGFLLFYISLFLASAGTISLIALLIRAYMVRDELIFRLVTRSFRQGLLFSLLIIGTLFLQSKRYLTWWNLLLLIFGLTALEFFFVSNKKQRPVLEQKDDAENPELIIDDNN